MSKPTALVSVLHLSARGDEFAVNLRKPPRSKRCTRCEIEQPIANFQPRWNRPGKYESHCRACLTAIRTTPERRARARAKRDADRAAVIAIYGGRCVSCGLDDHRFLEFDHVDDNGGEHRKIEGVSAWCSRIAREGERDERWRIQLLCRPCHQGSGRPGKSGRPNGSSA